jgi:hypothetical protein
VKQVPDIRYHFFVRLVGIQYVWKRNATSVHIQNIKQRKSLEGKEEEEERRKKKRKKKKQQ